MIFGLPAEMDCSKTQRRPGAENGPSQFHKILKYSPMVTIDDPSTSYLDCFGYMGSDCHSYTEPSFKNKFDSLRQTMKSHDVSICIGGDMLALPTLVTEDIDVVIKISPSLSRGPLATGAAPDHLNYITALPAATRSKIIHFGVLDYTNNQKQVDAVVGEDQAKIVYLDKLGQTNAKIFSDLLQSLKPDTKLAVVLDCESLTPDYFPGVSDPMVFGLVEAEIFPIIESLGKSPVSLLSLAFANFNPAVESRRSSDCLLYLIYTYLQSIKSKSPSVLPAKAN